MDAELWTCEETTELSWVVDTGGTVVEAAGDSETVAVDTEVTVVVVVDTWAVAVFSVAGITALSGNDVVVVTNAGAGVASVRVVSGDGGDLTIVSEVVSGAGGVEVCTLEGALTPSVGDGVAATVFASSSVATLVATGVGEQVGLGGATDVAEDLTGWSDTSVVDDGVETVLVLAGEGGAVSAPHGGAAVTSGVVEASSDMSEFEFNKLVCGSSRGVVVATIGLAWTVFSGGVTVVFREISLHETRNTGEVEVTEAVVDVGEDCRKSFTAVVIFVVREFTANVIGADVVDVESDG